MILRQLFFALGLVGFGAITRSPWIIQWGGWILMLCVVAAIPSMTMRK